VADPYTIRIFVPDGNPEGLRIIDRMNWTGLGITFPREDWPKIKQRVEFGRAGVYILIGRVTDDDLPTIYIGQGDVLRPRLDSHFANKDFWSSAAVFVSSAAGGGLNRAHATWLEHALIHRRYRSIKAISKTAPNRRHRNYRKRKEPTRKHFCARCCKSCR